MRMIYLWIFIILGMAVTAKAYIQDYHTFCEGKVCNYVSQPRFIKENNEWKTLEEAKSLKSVYKFMYDEYDPRYEIFVDDFNLTSARFCLKSTLLNVAVPFEIYEQKEKKISKYKGNHWFTNLFQKCYTFKVDDIRNYKFKFGKNSTIIYLDSGDILIDSYVRQGLPNNNYGSSSVIELLDRASESDSRDGFITWDTSDIPNGSTIDNDILSGFVNFNGLDSSTEGFNVSVQRVTGDWSESGITWNNQPSYDSTIADTLYFYGGAGAPSNWQNWNSTDILRVDIANKDNSSIAWIAHDYFGSPASNDQLQMTSRSGSASQRPLRNVTYTISTVIDGIYNKTFFNLSHRPGVQVNNGQLIGTYMSNIFSVNVTANHTNLTTSTSSVVGDEVEVSLREFLLLDDDVVALWMEKANGSNYRNYGSLGSTVDMSMPSAYNWTRETYNESYGTSGGYKIRSPNPGFKYTDSNKVSNMSTFMICSWNNLTGGHFFWRGDNNIQTSDIGGSYYYFRFRGLTDEDWDWQRINGQPAFTGNKTFVCVGYNGSNFLGYRDGTFDVGDATTGTVSWNNEHQIGLYGTGNIYMTFLINGTKDEAWLDQVYEKTRMSWQPYNTYQTLSNGQDEVNWSMNDSTDLIRFRYKISNKSKLHQQSYVFSNLSITAGAPPADTCTPSASGNYNVDASDKCRWTTNDIIYGNVTCTGTGDVILYANWTWVNKGNWLNIHSGCDFSLNQGGSFN